MAVRLRELVPAAINVLERGLADPNLNVAVRAAVEVLDRDARFSRTATLNVEHRIPDSEIQKARELALEMCSLQRINVQEQNSLKKEGTVIEIKCLPETS